MKIVEIIMICFTLSLTSDVSAQQLKFAPAPGSPIAVGDGPADIALGDFDMDKKLDIVTANSQGGDLSILLGDGSGGFTPAQGSPIRIGPNAHLVATGDVNKDGYIDIVVTQHDTYSVTVLHGTGKGSFTPASGSPFVALNAPRPHNHGLALRDINGDGNLDIATSNHGNNSVSVLLGNSKTGFIQTVGSPFTVGRGPYPLALADLNGDTYPDIATPNVADNTVTVLIGNGNGIFAPAQGSPYSVEFRPYYAVIGDVNSNRKPDIVTTHDDITKMTILLGDGKGRFAQAPNSPFDLGKRSFKVVVVDLDRDQKMDLVVCSYPRYVTILLGDGKGGFARSKSSPLEVGNGPSGLAVGDVNGDGRLDIVISNSESNTVSVLFGDSSKKK